jgi:dienelactone hydrolase
MIQNLGIIFLWLAVAQGAAGDEQFQQLKEMYDYDPQQPLHVQEKLLYQREGVKVYDLSYASPKGGRVTAYLVTPNGKGPFAGLVFGHWGPGNRTEFLPEASRYARADAVSLLIDYPWVRPAPWRKSLKEADNPEWDHQLFIQAVVDLRRGIDLLSDRPDVDPKRLAYVGHSFGAQWGAILSAVDNRLKGVVLMGGIPDQAAIYRDGNDPAVVEYRATTPKEKQEATSSPPNERPPRATCPMPNARCYSSLLAMNAISIKRPWTDTLKRPANRKR